LVTCDTNYYILYHVINQNQIDEAKRKKFKVICIENEAQFGFNNVDILITNFNKSDTTEQVNIVKLIIKNNKWI
jgi:hypothetical protein